MSTNYTVTSRTRTHWDHIDGVVLGLSVMVMGGLDGENSDHIVWGEDLIQPVSYNITLTCPGELAMVFQLKYGQ